MASDPVAQLHAMIERVRALADPDAFAPAAADALREEITSNIQATRGPDGKDWALTDAGKRPLKNAAAAVHVAAVGSRVVARLSGPEAFHHKGQTRGAIARPILPSRKLSQPMTRALRKALIARFGEIMVGEG